MELDDQQQPRFFDPRGREIVASPEPATPANLGWASIVDDNAGLEITAETNACLWDGDPVQYGHIIDGLVLLDGLT